MLNNRFRSYVRNRPKFFKKLRRSGRFSGAELPFRGFTKTFSGTPVLPNTNIRHGSFKRKVPETYVGNLRGVGKKRNYEEVGFLEHFLRSHPKIADNIDTSMWWAWDHGGRAMVRFPLKRRRRGQLRGHSTYEDL